MNEHEFFNEWQRLTVALKESEKGRLIDAIVNYAIFGKTTVLTGNEGTIFPIFQNLLKEKQNRKAV